MGCGYLILVEKILDENAPLQYCKHWFFYTIWSLLNVVNILYTACCVLRDKLGKVG